MSDYKTFNGLMKHMRTNSSITIGGSTMKKELINMGYFHGYKGYRFFRNQNNYLPFTSFNQINETYILDCKLKTLFYEKLMFIETALKSRVLDCIMSDINSSNLYKMYNEAFEGFSNCNSNYSFEKKEKIQKAKLGLQSKINHLIEEAYQKHNPKITHFYETPSCNGELPLWASFELLTFGVFGDLLKALKPSLKLKISSSLKIPSAFDTNGKFLQDSVYLLRDLRNTVAHNEVCYDCRFRRGGQYSTQVPANITNLLMSEYHLGFVHFNDIVDYVALICYLMKKFGSSKTENRRFVTQVEEALNTYKNNINDNNITSLTLGSGMLGRLSTIKKFL